jgi:prepilin peptidase CpaA
MPDLIQESPVNSLTATPAPAGLNSQTPTPPAVTADDDLGLDRAFVLSMARVPLIAIGWAAASVIVWKILATLAPSLSITASPVICICIGMVLAAIIDGWAYKVPNWLTLSLVISGWYLGLLHDFGYSGEGFGGIGSALLGTVMGWALLFPALFIGGMGQGDVKMQMGFGSWIGATFGFFKTADGLGGDAAMILLCSFAVGVIVGGVFGIVMMACRRQFHKNLQNTKEIFTDLQIMLTAGPKQAAERANSRRKDWVRLPYGVPLCVGFLGFLAYHFGLFGGN